MTPYEQALADIRSIPIAPTAGPASLRSTAGCCSGTRNGYQWHINHKVPPCAESREANRLWHAEYQRRRKERAR